MLRVLRRYIHFTEELERVRLQLAETSDRLAALEAQAAIATRNDRKTRNDGKVIKRDREPVQVYVDGACRGNGTDAAKGGYGVWYGHDHAKNASVSFSECDPYSRPTNQRSELLAMRHALNDIVQSPSDSYEVYSDSKYAIQCTSEWLPKWESNGWKNARRESVANRDVLEEISELNRRIEQNGTNVRMVHVRGHGDERGNIEADRLAVEAAKRDGVDG